MCFISSIILLAAVLLGTAAVAAADSGMHKKISGTTALIISNEQMDIMKIVKSLEDLVYWLKVLVKQLKMKQMFIKMLLGQVALEASLLRNLKSRMRCN